MKKLDLGFISDIQSDQIKSVLMLAAAGFVVYKYLQVSGVVSDSVDYVEKQATTTFNPASNDNFIYSATKNDKGTGLGSWLFKVLN